MFKEAACLLILFCCVLSAEEEQWAVSAHGMNVPFRSWQAEGAKAGTGVLVLVPGYNKWGQAARIHIQGREPEQANSMIKETACLLILLRCVLSTAEEQWAA